MLLAPDQFSPQGADQCHADPEEREDHEGDRTGHDTGPGEAAALLGRRVTRAPDIAS